MRIKLKKQYFFGLQTKKKKGSEKEALLLRSLFLLFTTDLTNAT